MKLILKSSKLPPLYTNENKKAEETPILVKLFNPIGTGRWYLTEYDEETKMAFGLCNLGEPELGYVSISDLENVKLPFGLKIERDLHWDPKTTLKQVMDGLTHSHD